MPVPPPSGTAPKVLRMEKSDHGQSREGDLPKLTVDSGLREQEPKRKESWIRRGKLFSAGSKSARKDWRWGGRGRPAPAGAGSGQGCERGPWLSCSRCGGFGRSPLHGSWDGWVLCWGTRQADGHRQRPLASPGRAHHLGRGCRWERSSREVLGLPHWHIPKRVSQNHGVAWVGTAL